MQSLNPTRIVQRQGREVMIIGAIVMLLGLLACGCSVVAFLLLSSTQIGNVIGYALIVVGGIVLLVGIGLLVRGLTLRMENQGAIAVADELSRVLDARYTLIRNVSRRRLGYVDAILVGPPGALVFRILDIPGTFSNEGSDWLERDSKGGQTFVLSKLNATRECVTDIYALRKYLARFGLSQVPVFGIVVFTNAQASLSARQPVVPIAELRTLPTVLRRDFLAEDRIDAATVDSAVQAIYT
ncbi:MAG: nuclease-related domain-containing protein [Chloroflexota bacterium]